MLMNQANELRLYQNINKLLECFKAKQKSAIYWNYPQLQVCRNIVICQQPCNFFVLVLIPLCSPTYMTKGIYYIQGHRFCFIVVQWVLYFIAYHKIYLRFIFIWMDIDTMSLVIGLLLLLTFLLEAFFLNTNKSPLVLLFRVDNASIVCMLVSVLRTLFGTLSSSLLHH